MERQKRKNQQPAEGAAERSTRSLKNFLSEQPVKNAVGETLTDKADMMAFWVE